MQLLATLKLHRIKENTEMVKVVWVSDEKKAGYYHRLYNRNYLAFKKHMIKYLDLAPEYSQEKSDMFHSYDMYLEGETIFIYDLISYNQVV